MVCFHFPFTLPCAIDSLVILLVVKSEKQFQVTVNSLALLQSGLC